MTVTAIETAPAKAAPTDTGVCGTEAGHGRHRRRGEQPCRPCRLAATQAEVDRRPRLRPAAARAAREAAPVPPVFGLGAGTDVPHEFVPLSISQCLVCFGWRDDPRHPVVGGPVVGR
jgi:hypothetical protein